jgi:hypothetical protein
VSAWIAFSSRLPAAPWAAWLASALFAVVFLPITLLLLLFPAGRLPSRRWWGVIGMAVVSTGVLGALVLGDTAVYADGIAIPNPLRLPLERVGASLVTASELLGLFAFAVALVQFIAAGAQWCCGGVGRTGRSASSLNG